MEEELKEFSPHCKIEEAKVTINLKKFVQIYYKNDDEKLIVRIRLNGSDKIKSNEKDNCEFYACDNFAEISKLVEYRINQYARNVEDILGCKFITEINELDSYVIDSYGIFSEHKSA